MIKFREVEFELDSIFELGKRFEKEQLIEAEFEFFGKQMKINKIGHSYKLSIDNVAVVEYKDIDTLINNIENYVG